MGQNVTQGFLIPTDTQERAFLDYWARYLLDPRDPQRERWLKLEMGQVSRGREMVKTLAKWVTLRGARVLDVGCQTGALAIALSEVGAEVTGLDVDSALVNGASVRAGCYGICADFRTGHAERLPFAADTFDLVTFVDVIEHVDDARTSLAEIARVLRPGGVLYLQGPNRFSPRWFWRDPHYGLTGISILPKGLGRFYVTRVRGFPHYHVGVFPIGSTVVRTLGSLGLSIVRPPHDPSAGFARRCKGAMALRFGSMFTIVASKPLWG